jgi:hypothetical protein
MPMRLSHSLVLAGALFVAAPALAQDNAAAPGNTVSTSGVDANTAATNGAAVTPTTAAATPGVQNATLPPHIATPEDTGTTMAVKSHRGFPWGVLGLIGLLGLFGVRKASS